MFLQCTLPPSPALTVDWAMCEYVQVINAAPVTDQVKLYGSVLVAIHICRLTPEAIVWSIIGHSL